MEAHGVGCLFDFFFPFLYYVFVVVFVYIIIMIIIINDENYSFSSKFTMVSRSPSISPLNVKLPLQALRKKKTMRVV